MGKLKRKMLKKAAKYAFKAAKKGAEEYVFAPSPKTDSKGTERTGSGMLPRTVGSMTLRHMRSGDKKEIIDMMREFHASKQPPENSSDRIFSHNIAECLSDSPFLNGYVFAYKESDSSLWGYALVANGFSTELGKRCMRIEEIYIREEARKLGLEAELIKSLEAVYPDRAIIRKK